MVARPKDESFLRKVFSRSVRKGRGTRVSCTGFFPRSVRKAGGREFHAQGFVPAVSARPRNESFMLR
eukprot:871690-Alexandrium_andersonii.AAC.1